MSITTLTHVNSKTVETLIYGADDEQLQMATNAAMLPPIAPKILPFPLSQDDIHPPFGAFASLASYSFPA